MRNRGGTNSSLRSVELCLCFDAFFGGSFHRLCMWLATPKTTWFLIFTWIAWPWPNQTPVTGAATSRDSWTETVCVKTVFSSLTEQNTQHSLVQTADVFKALFLCFSAIWILVWPCDRLVEEEGDSSKPPLHVLWRLGWGISCRFERLMPF